jgi:protein-tyrosine phosphatase
MEARNATLSGPSDRNHRIDRIIPFFFITSAVGSKQKKPLAEKKISHILSCGSS